MPTDLTHIRYVNGTVDRWRNIFRFVNMVAHVGLSIVLFIQLYVCNVRLFDNTLFKTVSLDYKEYTTRLPARAAQTCQGYVDCFRKGVPWDQNYQVGFINLDSIQWNSFTMLFAIEWITASMSISFLKQDLFKPPTIQELNHKKTGNWLIQLVAVLYQGTGIGLYFLYVTQIKGYDMFEVILVTISFAMSFFYILFADRFFKNWIDMLPKTTDNMTQGAMQQVYNGKVWNIPSKFLNAGGPVLLEPEVHIREGLQGIIWRQLWIVTRYLEYSCTSPPLFVIILNLIVYGQPLWTSVIGYICILSCCLLAIPLHIMYIQEITYTEIQNIEMGLVPPTDNDKFQAIPHYLEIIKPGFKPYTPEYTPRFPNKLVDNPRPTQVVDTSRQRQETPGVPGVTPVYRAENYQHEHNTKERFKEQANTIWSTIAGRKGQDGYQQTINKTTNGESPEDNNMNAIAHRDDFRDQHFHAATRPGAVVYGPEHRPVSPVPKDGNVLVPPSDLPIARSDPVLPPDITNATPVPVPNDGAANAVVPEPQMHGEEITEEHQGENESVQENTEIQEIVLMAEKELQEAQKMNEVIQGAGDLNRGDLFESTRLLGQIQTQLENLKVVIDLSTAKEKKKIFDSTFDELKHIHDKALTAIDTEQSGAAEENGDYNTDQPPVDLNEIRPIIENDHPANTNTLETLEPEQNTQGNDESNVKVHDGDMTIQNSHVVDNNNANQHDNNNGQAEHGLDDTEIEDDGIVPPPPQRGSEQNQNALNLTKIRAKGVNDARTIFKKLIKQPQEESGDKQDEQTNNPEDENNQAPQGPQETPRQPTAVDPKAAKDVTQKELPGEAGIYEKSTTEDAFRRFGLTPRTHLPIPTGNMGYNPWPFYQYPAIISNMFYDYPHWQYSAVSTVDDQPFCNVQPLLTTPKKKVPVINVPIDRPSGLTKRKSGMLGASQGEITYIDIYNSHMTEYRTANIKNLILSFLMLGKWRSNWVVRVQLMQTIWLCISMAIAIMIYVAQDFLYNSMIYGQTRFLVWFSIIAYSGFIAINALYYTFHLYGKTYDILDVWMDAWSSLVKILITVVIMWGYLHTVDGKCTYNPF